MKLATDTAYFERANASYEAWTYSDGQRIFLGRWDDRIDAIRWLRSKRYRVVEVKP